MTFTRYPAPRVNAGRIFPTRRAGGGPAPTDPLSIVTSVPVLAYFVADLGVTIGTGVSAWADQGPSAYSAVQATGTAQPLLQTAALGGSNTILFDGVDDRLVVGTLDLPAPGTTPTFLFFVARRVTGAINVSMFGGGGSTTMRLFRGGADLIRMNNGTSGPTVTMVAGGPFYRGEALYANSATVDYLKIGTVNSGVGTATGNNDAGAGQYTIGAQQLAGTNAGNDDIAVVMLCGGNPSAAEKAALDAWVTAYYNGVVVV
jgi:hypothetical protein